MPRAAKGRPKVKIPYSPKGDGRASARIVKIIDQKFAAARAVAKRYRFLYQRDADEIWLATAEVCSVTDACAPLENHAFANYTVVLEENFYKETLRLLKRK